MLQFLIVIVLYYLLELDFPNVLMMCFLNVGTIDCLDRIFLCCGIVQYIVGSLAVSLASTHQMPVAQLKL